MAVDEIGTKPDEIGTTWAEDDPTPYPADFPPGSKSDVGYQPEGLPLPEDPGEIIDAKWWNGIVQYVFRAVNWIAAGHTRVFETLAGGIAATTPPALFVVQAPALGLRAMGDIAFAVYGGAGASTGTNNYIFLPCTDGVRIYYHEGEFLLFEIYAADPADGSPLWGPITVGTFAQALACDGERVYYTDFDDVQAVYSLDPADGLAIGQSDTAGLGIEKLKANGEFLIGIDPTNNRVHVHSDVQETTLVYDGYAQSPEFSVDSIAIDHINGYWGGDRGLSGTYDVYQFVLSTLAIGWTTTLPTLAGSAGRVHVRAMVSDGVTLFLSTERIALLAGGFATVYALNALDGSVIWSADTGYSGHDSAIAIDDYWVYVGNENQNHTQVLDKRTGRIVHVIADHVAYGADGVSTIGQGGSLSPNGDKITRNWRGGPSRKLQRVYGVDPNRHPFHTLAVPTTERP